ncbi:flagellar protein FlaG protein [Desulfofarcimen acetoxidans DSM 771]|uniref:Flagellar protein FlaG protein n=1 Tax=Desulfofarcimen acetoxidans (strain ATCC 49208 / DSM 771 / KCTC 5769 / VKM B-1644 / 5575) TaxID=485916 RepID=C8W1D8_DESAS|nr:flagellar protein FlaG [Desulfofarcimen acetoxidans]ACV61583.1 flagellar protein FlaG protein [Desulfofarcimen acetoxidans DSM 771]
MKVGGGGLEALATQDLTTSLRKTEKSEPIPNADDAVDSSQAQVNPDQLIKAVENLNKTSDLYNQGLQFKVHEETKQLVVQIVNQESGEVIKQIPPEEVLDMEARIGKMVGLIIDKKA